MGQLNGLFARTFLNPPRSFGDLERPKGAGVLSAKLFLPTATVFTQSVCVSSVERRFNCQAERLAKVGAGCDLVVGQFGLNTKIRDLKVFT